MTLVKAHLHQAHRTASGAQGLWGPGRSLAATQAAWRFLNNDQVTLGALVEPLRETGRTALRGDAAPVALLVHDWSKLAYTRRGSGSDTAVLTHEKDVGYELATALLVSAAHGGPLAPLQMHLKTGQGVHSTQGKIKDQAHVDQVLPTMRAAQQWGLGKPLVHVIDREVDSVGHYRQWDGAGQMFLVRADDRVVQWGDRTLKLTEVVAKLAAAGTFKVSRQVRYKGKKRTQRVAQTRVILHKPAKRRVHGKQIQVPGEPIELRLVVSQVCAKDGRVLATWLLLTNVSPALADAATIALWYYWRWRIENYFKLLKSHGHEVEYWQQETGLAIARRLLVCAMACVVVWDLMRQKSQDAQELRALLVRLSGRQMKYGVSFTAPALLAGLTVLLPILCLLEEHGGDLSRLQQLAQDALPQIFSGDV